MLVFFFFFSRVVSKLENKRLTSSDNYLQI